VCGFGGGCGLLFRNGRCPLFLGGGGFIKIPFSQIVQKLVHQLPVRLCPLRFCESIAGEKLPADTEKPFHRFRNRRRKL